jgi:pimeloyl-ACP methyl ester carboxylesterase
LGATAAALAASDVFALDSDGNGAGVLRKYSSATNKTGAARMFGPIHQVDAGVLNIGYAELGPSGGAPVILLHGWPYDIHSYREVATQLADRGCRVIVPHLRGHGTTRFLDQSVPRSGQQAALGADVIALMDALEIPKAVLAGYDWGGRAACVAATIDGDADGVVPATDGRSSAGKFTGGREHRILPRIGHNPPQEAPSEFAAAVLDLVANKQNSSQRPKESLDGRS